MPCRIVMGKQCLIGLFIIVSAIAGGWAMADDPAGNMVLWYRQPAKQWVEGPCPSGTGRWVQWFRRRQGGAIAA